MQVIKCVKRNETSIKIAPRDYFSVIIRQYSNFEMKIKLIREDKVFRLVQKVINTPKFNARRDR